MSRHWSKLRPIYGFTRIRDAADGTRRCRCDRCGHIIPTLGVGYHVGGGGNRPALRDCRERFPDGWSEKP